MEGPVIGDAFGQMLLDTMAASDPGEPYPEVIERDDGLIDVGDPRRYFATSDEWRPTEREMIDRLSGRVLDVGAGAGRVGLYLQERGCDVVALDVSEGALEVCHRRGVRATFHGTVYEVAQTRPHPFDAFVLCGNNMGLLASRDEAPRFLSTLASMAVPGAIILGTWVDQYLTDNPLHLAYHQWNRERGRMPGQMRLRCRHRNLATPWFDYLFCSPAEAEEIIARSHWELAELTREEVGPGYTVLLRLRAIDP